MDRRLVFQPVAICRVIGCRAIASRIHISFGLHLLALEPPTVVFRRRSGVAVFAGFRSGRCRFDGLNFNKRLTGCQAFGEILSHKCLISQ